MLDIKQLQQQHVRLPFLTLAVASLLVAGCDDYGPDEELSLDDQALDAELSLDDQALDAELVLDEEFGDLELEADPEFEADPVEGDLEIEAGGPEADPYSVNANWVGGSGGNLFTINCPTVTIGPATVATTAIGVAAAPTPDGNLVRQIALVCAPEAGVDVSQQVVLWSGYLNSGFQVSPGWNWRPVWDASPGNPLPSYRYKAPNTRYAMCDPGYRLSQVVVQAGWFVDRVDHITCYWDGGEDLDGPLIYSVGFDGSPWWVGGNGGNYDGSSCMGTSEKFADGIRFRSAHWLDGFGLICEE